MDEETLIRQAGQGDESAFFALVDRFCPEIYSIVRQKTGDEDAAVSRTEETFLRAWHAIELYQGEPPFRAWLEGLAEQVCGDVSQGESPATPMPPDLPDAIKRNIQKETAGFQPAAWIKRFRFTLLALVIAALLLLSARCGNGKQVSRPAAVQPSASPSPSHSVDAAFLPGT